MIVKREKYYIKKIGENIFAGNQKIKRTSFWLFGIIPLYIKEEVLSGTMSINRKIFSFQ